MKKRIALVLTIAMILPTCISFAEEADDPMAVTLISGPEEEESSEPVSLDDVKTDKEIEIDGFGTITFTAFEFRDRDIYLQGNNGGWISSGEEADYACLYCDIVNTNTKDKDYLANVEVKAIYDEQYEYAGWGYQIDRDKGDDWIEHEHELAFSISPMYTGHYVFGATLPNAVINGNKELKIVMKIDGNEMTYYVRK